jgi:hypothetical protein
MTKFNQKKTISDVLLAHPDAVQNHEFGLAFEMDAKTELMTRVLTALVSEDKFYTSGKDADSELNYATNKVLECDPEFILKLAAYARNVMNLRSVPVFLLNKFANSGCQIVGSRKYVPMCIQRVDEITELLAANLQTRKKPAQFIKNGLVPCFNQFDAYQYGKYNREGTVTLKDAIFLCHPHADTSERQLIFDQIINGVLQPPETWEVVISTNGASKETWESIIPKMGYMALLRNLNNFLKHDVDLEPVIKLLTDEKAVRKSKQFPFRFFSAYRAIQQEGYSGKKVTALMNALNTAIELSIQNVPKIPGKSLVLIDVSGSMSSNRISAKSTITPADISCMFGAIASKVCEEADIYPFAEKTTQIHFSDTSGILDRMEKLKTVNVGGATYAFLPMEHARQNKTKYDRIFLFSDMQCYTASNWLTGSSFAEAFIRYQREVSQAALYSVDLTGYGSAQVPEDTNKVCLLAGWSERIFDFVQAFEADRGTMIQVVESYGKS